MGRIRTRSCQSCFDKGAGYCNSCEAIRRDKYRPRYRQREKTRAKRRRSTAEGKRYLTSKILKTRYGIEIEDKERMVIAQNGCCAICGTVPRRLVVDHCHSTNMVRALLCDRCNRGIGSFEDNGELLRAAAAYVDKYAS